MIRRSKIKEPVNGKSEIIFEGVKESIELSVDNTDAYDIILNCILFVEEFKEKKPVVMMFDPKGEKKYLLIGHDISYIIYENETKVITFDADGLVIVQDLVYSIKDNIDKWAKSSCKGFNIDDSQRLDELKGIIKSFEDYFINN